MVSQRLDRTEWLNQIELRYLNLQIGSEGVKNYDLSEPTLSIIHKVIRREHWLKSGEDERNTIYHIGTAMRVNLDNWDQGVGQGEDTHMNFLNFILMAEGKGSHFYY